MIIEIIKDNLGMIWGFRTGWKPWTKNPPNPQNVYVIAKKEHDPLVEFLAGRPVIIGTEEHHDAQFWNRLYLTALDIQNPLTRRDKDFFNAVLHN